MPVLSEYAVALFLVAMAMLYDPVSVYAMVIVDFFLTMFSMSDPSPALAVVGSAAVRVYGPTRTRRSKPACLRR
jgi:hypothetical protein